eukprot:jgi/Undpi1/8587/HiC_scaffold_25.g11052.m1
MSKADEPLFTFILRCYTLSRFSQAVLIVNVASRCGYTDSNYRELQTLRTRHSEDRLTIIAFPCNQFGGQEPAPWREIVDFVDREYGASFPVMAKVNVNGHESHPIFAWLKAASGIPEDIPWNFSKFLVTCGDRVKRYSHEAGDTECPLQVCQLSRSSESTHFRSFVEM